MMTAARVTDAAKEAASLLAKGGKAAAEVVRSDTLGNLSLDVKRFTDVILIDNLIYIPIDGQ